jgi:hypothetical protein
MARYKVGFDFGTSSAKIVYRNLDTGQFGISLFDGKTEKTTSLCIDNGKCLFGTQPSGNMVVYRYFKMASFIEESYITLIKEDVENIGNDFQSLYSNTNFLNHSTGDNISPEFISSLFICDTAFEIEQSLGGVSSTQFNFFSSQKDEKPDDTFSYVFGFPTEFNTKQHTKRLLKMRCILFVAFKLKELYGTWDEFKRAQLDELLGYTHEILNELKASGDDLLKNYLIKLGISTYPEAAASLALIRETKSLTSNRYFASIDIGAGTSDVSLFYITPDYNIRYLASESVAVAANNLASFYMEAGDNISISKFHELIKQGGLNALDRSKYENSLRLFYKLLERSLYKLYNQRAFKVANGKPVMEMFHEQPCVVYGGGSIFIESETPFCIHDNFNPSNFTNLTYLLASPLLKSHQLAFMGIAQIKDMSEMTIQRLAVAIGLAVTASEVLDYSGLEIKPSWLMLEDYIDSSGNRIEQTLVPHPTNEDMYITVPVDQFYDLLKQEFVKY